MFESTSEKAFTGTAKITSWDTAFGWGDHALTGYLTNQSNINSLSDVDTTTTGPTQNQVLAWNGNKWVPATSTAGTRVSGFSDTIMLVNEVNRNHFLDKDMQYWFLLNSIRSKKRFSPFLRASKLKNIDLVKEYYGYSNEKAKSALSILNKQQIETIKKSLQKGGRHKRK